MQAHAAHLVGTWRGLDAAGDDATLRFNKFGMCSVELADARHKGPVSFGEDSLTVAPIPLPVLSSLGSTTTLRVSKWPASPEDDTLVAEGVTYTRLR